VASQLIQFGPNRLGPMQSWAVPAAIIVGVEYSFALVVGARVGFRYQIPFATYFIVGATVAAAAGTVVLATRLFVYFRECEAHPTRRLLAELPSFYGFAVGVMLVTAQMAALSWTKIMLPIASPFWADPLLANLDHTILRVEPWRVAEAVFGWAAPLIDRAYVTWAPIKLATLTILLALPETRTKSRALIAYFAIMASAAIGQYLLSSGGPVFYARLGFGDRFADLPMEPWVATTTAYLWHDYLNAGGDIGGGISAMPSLHVAMALWVALVVRAYVPRLAVLGFAYFSAILIGSVLLGWHYAVDGIAAIAIAAVVWRLAGKFVSTGRKEAFQISRPVAEA
jgi:hypothetical protein